MHGKEIKDQVLLSKNRSRGSVLNHGDTALTHQVSETPEDYFMAQTADVRNGEDAHAAPSTART